MSTAKSRLLGVDKYADDDIADLLNIFSPKIMKWDEYSGSLT